MRSTIGRNLVILFRERVGDVLDFARAAKVRQVRAEDAALGLDHVAASAVPLAPEDCFAAGDIARGRRVDCRPAKTADVRGDAPDLIVGELSRERRHLRARDAVLHGIEDLIVRAPQVPAVLRSHRRAELSAFAVLAVAGGARLVVELLSFGDRFAIANGRIGLGARRGRTAAALCGSEMLAKSREQMAKSRKAPALCPLPSALSQPSGSFGRPYYFASGRANAMTFENDVNATY